MLTKSLCSAFIFGLLVEFAVCRTAYTGYPGLNYYDFNGLSPFSGGTLGSILAYQPINEPYQTKAVDQKRAYMRLGKRAMMRLGKRSETEIGTENDISQMEKRARMRLGR